MSHADLPGPKIAINAVAVLGIFFTLAGLIWIMNRYTRPEAVEEARWAERQKNLAELRAQNQELLDHFTWIDQSRGLVRLPIARAMELTVHEWQTPALGRSNLLARLERAAPRPSPTTTNASPANPGPTNSAPLKR
jgi:hypothetical protein